VKIHNENKFKKTSLVGCMMTNYCDLNPESFATGKK
jgi:hypothetical protein